MKVSEFQIRYLGQQHAFCAVESPRGCVTVLDHEGNNYGTWRSVQSFQDFVRVNPERDFNVIGKKSSVVFVKEAAHAAQRS